MNAQTHKDSAGMVESARDRLPPPPGRHEDLRARPRESTLEWRKPSLSQGPVTPLASKPTAPFAESEHKKACTVARYYAECQLNGIDALQADSAADDAQRNFENWWVKVTAKQQHERAHKRQKVEQNEAACNRKLALPVYPISCARVDALRHAKQAAINSLTANGGDTTTTKFMVNLDVLTSEYAARGLDARWEPGTEECILDGTWYTLSKPTFSECLGKKRDNEYLYRLGRLSFDMFRPTSLLCSIQGCFNSIGKLDSTGLKNKPLPLRLFALRDRSSCVRRYDISESLTIEPKQTRDGVLETQEGTNEYLIPRPVKGTLMNEGFCVPDPDVPNRISIWFIGGTLQVEDVDHDLDEWRQIFDQSMAPRRDTKELARILAARLLLGAQVPDKVNVDGSMSYHLNRPIGGHGSAFVDVLYCDESLRILRGHQGSLYVSIRSL